MNDLLIKLSGNCSDTNTCPTILGYRKDPTQVVVQGPETTEEETGLTFPTGERAVVIPASVLIQAARELMKEEAAA